MPNMSAKATELSDPVDLLARIAYRNERMKTKLAEKDDPVAFVSDGGAQQSGPSASGGSS